MEAIIPQINQRREKEWFNRKEASGFLNSIGCPVAPATLAKMAIKGNSGKGPPFTKVRYKLAHYHREDLMKWAETQKVRIE